MSKQKIILSVALLIATYAVVSFYVSVHSSFANSGLEKALTGYLLKQNYFSWKNKENSRDYCAVENLNPGSEFFPLYVWELCEELSMENGALKVISGSSGPVKINYSGPLGNYDPGKFFYEAPGDGSSYSKDVGRIFPLNVQWRIRAYDASSLESKLKKDAQEDFNTCSK